MIKLQLGSECAIGVDECQEETMCLGGKDQIKGICRALCRNKECPNGFKCTFTALNGGFQPFCMPVPKSQIPTNKSEYKRYNVDVEDVLLALFGIIFFFLLCNVLRACFGGADQKETKKRGKQASDKSVLQPQVVYHTPGCPACAIQFTQYNAQQQGVSRPPPYHHPQPFSPNNFRQV
jgi:hypothetical protein